MPKITYIEHDGRQHIVDAPVGTSVMQAAVENLVPGILGDCGGNCSCSTCQVYVVPEWEGRLPPKLANEELLLSEAINVRANSRLGCQIRLSAELDGLTVEMPARQF